MHRRILPIGITALLGMALIAPTVSASSTRFMAPLSHAQEVGDVDAPGAGGSASLWLDGNTLHYRVDVRNLTGPAVMSHIHGTAPRHVDAGISVWLCQTAAFPGPTGTPQCATSTDGNLVTGSVAVTSDQIAMLTSGLAYVNVHTEAHLPGEVRGQVLATGGGS